MWKVLKFLKKNLVYSIPFFMLTGFITGMLIDPSFLKKSILFLTFLMVYPMMINLQVKKLFTPGDNKLVISAQIINFIIIPAFALFIGNLFFQDNPMMIMGMLLIGLIPTSGMTVSWTGFAGGNINGAVKIQISGLILGALLTPLYIKLLLGTRVEIPFMTLFIQILSIVVFPLILGVITRMIIVKYTGEDKYNKEIKQKFPLISTAGLFLMIFAAMALKAKAIYSNPKGVLYIIAPLIVFYLISYLISTIIGRKFFKIQNQSPIVFGTAMRNLSIALAIAMNVFGKDGSNMALLISIAYIIQVESAALYVKMMNKRKEKLPVTSHS